MKFANKQPFKAKDIRQFSDHDLVVITHAVARAYSESKQRPGTTASEVHASAKWLVKLKIALAARSDSDHVFIFPWPENIPDFSVRHGVPPLGKNIPRQTERGHAWCLPRTPVPVESRARHTQCSPHTLMPS